MVTMALGELLIILIVVAMLGGTLWGLINAARCPEYLFRSTGHSKTLWIALQFLLAPLGTILYVTLVWPSLRRHNLQAKPPQFDKSSDKPPLIWQ